MKKVIIALVLLATVSSTQAKVNAVTGQQEDMSWLQFIKLIAHKDTALARFVTGLQLSTLGITPGSGVSDFLVTPTSANLALAVTNETGSSLLVFNTSPTIVSPVISTGLTASGSAANTFVGSTGTFITSSGANTLSGAVTVNDATTPSITTAAGKTNTGFLKINGKTSGSVKLIPADAAGQDVTITVAAQTSGAEALTIPDFAGVADTFVFTTLAQSLASKTLVAPVISTGLTASGSASNDFSSSTGTFKTSSGISTVSGGLVHSTAALSGAGACSVTTTVTKLTTTGAAQALTLADGTNGQIKIIVHDVDGGSAVLTPTTKTGFSTITFTSVGETATLMFVTTRGWVILSLFGAVAA